MQLEQPAAAAAASPFPSALAAPIGEGDGIHRVTATSFADYKLIRRNGSVVAFEPGKIAVAMTKAFLAVRGSQAAASSAVREQVEKLTANAVQALLRRQPAGGTFHIEDVQDQVELSLMRDGAHDVARAYVLYREKRAQERARLRKEQAQGEPQLSMLDEGRRVPLDLARIRAVVDAACVGLTEYVSAETIVAETLRNLYDGVPFEEVIKSSILAARALS